VAVDETTSEVTGGGGTGTIGCVVWVGPVAECSGEPAGLAEGARARFACNEYTMRTAVRTSAIDTDRLFFVALTTMDENINLRWESAVRHRNPDSPNDRECLIIMSLLGFEASGSAGGVFHRGLSI
jgi:hypothetical protein